MFFCFFSGGGGGGGGGGFLATFICFCVTVLFSVPLFVFCGKRNKKLKKELIFASLYFLIKPVY